MSTYIDAVGHGFAADDEIVFTNVEGGETIIEGQKYYVLASGLTADTFQFSDTVGGSAISWTTDITEGTVAAWPTYSVAIDGVMDPPEAPSAPGSCALTSAAAIAPDGTVVTRLDITITQPTDATLRHTVVTVTGGSNTEKVIIPVGQTTGSIASVVPGLSYTATAVAYDTFGLASDPTVSSAHVAVGDTTAPAAPTSPVATGSILGVKVTWTGVSAADLSHYEVDIDTSNTFGSVIATYRAKTTILQISGLSAGTYYMRVRAVDLTGNAGSYSSTVNAAARTVQTADITAGAITATEITDGSISTPKLAANAVTADKLMIGVKEGVLSNWATGGDDASIWTNWSGAGTLSSVAVTDAQTGGHVLRVAGGMGWLIANDNIPYDPHSLYRVHVRVRQVSGASNTAIYAGVAGVAADGTTLVNILGVNSSSSQHYVTVAGDTLTAGAGWVDYVGYLSGVAASGTGVTRANSANPGALHEDARFIRPLVLVNYNGGTGTAEIDFVSVQRIDNTGVSNSTHDVIIDSSGITINNGALSFLDTYGQSVLTGGGFEGSWLRFISSRVYNNDFSQGTTGFDFPVSEVGSGSGTANYAASVSPYLPYWVVAASGGTLAIISDSTASGGLALRSTATGAAQTNRVYQDIPVAPGEGVRVLRNMGVTFSSSDCAVNVYVSWRKSDHSIIGTRFGGGLTYNATSAYAIFTDYPISPLLAPANASYLRYEMEFVHTNTGTTIWISDVALKDTAFQSSASCSSPLTVTTTPTRPTGLACTVGPGNYLVLGTLDLDMTVAGNTTIVGQLFESGNAQANQIIRRFGTTAATTAGRSTLSTSWIVTVLQGASGVLELKVSKTANVGTITANATHSTLIAIPLP